MQWPHGFGPLSGPGGRSHVLSPGWSHSEPLQHHIRQWYGPLPWSCTHEKLSLQTSDTGSQVVLGVFSDPCVKARHSLVVPLNTHFSFSAWQELTSNGSHPPPCGDIHVDAPPPVPAEPALPPPVAPAPELPAVPPVELGLLPLDFELHAPRLKPAMAKTKKDVKSRICTGCPVRGGSSSCAALNQEPPRRVVDEGASARALRSSAPGPSPRQRPSAGACREAARNLSLGNTTCGTCLWASRGCRVRRRSRTRRCGSLGRRWLPLVTEIPAAPHRLMRFQH